MNREALVEKIMQDQAFVDQLSDAESAEAAQKLFASKGVEFTLEEVKAIAAGVQAENGELSEDDLEAVSGGVSLKDVDTIVKIINGVVTIIDKIRKWKW